MTKNTTYTERFTIDFISKKIIGTQASFNKASKGTGEIYEELASKIAGHLSCFRSMSVCSGTPNFRCVVDRRLYLPVLP